MPVMAPTGSRDLLARVALARAQARQTGGSFARYADAPVAFVTEVLGQQPWSKQIAILEALNHHRARVAVKACHASGKSWTAAAAASWFLTTTPGSVVITTAPTARQVEEILWREIRDMKRASKLTLPGDVLPRDPRWEVSDKWFALGLSTDEPERFQGFHAPRILVIEDEASGIPETIQAAIEGVLSSGDARHLMIGNPTQVSGHFHAAFTTNRGIAKTFTISAFDTPNLTGEEERPYLASPDWVAERRQEWGEDSDLWRVRVLGEFPLGTLDTVVGLADVEAARTRELDWPNARFEVGVDVARFGDDRSVIVGRAGPVVLFIETLTKRDTVFVAGRVRELVTTWAPQLNTLTARVVVKVDDASMGGGVTDQLRALGLDVAPVNASERAFDKEKYPNRRSELWFATANRLHEGDMDLSRIPEPVYDSLVAELTAPKWRMDGQGRRVVEPKGDFKARLGRSPDIADALNLAFTPRRKAGMAPLAFGEDGRQIA